MRVHNGSNDYMFALCKAMGSHGFTMVLSLTSRVHYFLSTLKRENAYGFTWVHNGSSSLNVMLIVMLPGR